jgi:hypothetical protein
MSRVEVGDVVEHTVPGMVGFVEKVDSRVIPAGELAVVVTPGRLAHLNGYTSEWGVVSIGYYWRRIPPDELTPEQRLEVVKLKILHAAKGATP